MGPTVRPLRYFAMSVGASGSDLPPALRSSRSPLPSEAPIRDLQFGDFTNDEIAASQGPAVVLKTKLNYNSANSDDFADQRPTSDAPSTPARKGSPVRKEGPATQVTPPYKARSASASAPASPRFKKGELRSFTAGDLALSSWWFAPRQEKRLCSSSSFRIREGGSLERRGALLLWHRRSEAP